MFRRATSQSSSSVEPPEMSAGVVDTRIGQLEFTHDFVTGYPTDENWIPTEPGRAFFAMLRFFSPGETLLDRSWV